MAIDTTNMKSSTLNLLKLAAIVAVIGALNWGLIGIANFNLVDAILGGGAHEETSVASRVVYTIVGLAGLATLFLLPSKQSVHPHEPLRVS